MSSSDPEKENRAAVQQVAAGALKELTVKILQGGCSNQKRTNKEAHPKAVLSTKNSKQRAEEPSDVATTPVCTSPRTLCSQVVPSPSCKVSRQRSTPVDPLPIPSPSRPAEFAECVEMEASPTTASRCFRPASLCLGRELSRSSSNGSGSQGVATPCPDVVSSYPPPSNGQLFCRPQSYEGAPGQCPGCRMNNCLCLPANVSDPQKVLARRIADRLIVIGDNVNFDTATLSLSEIWEFWQSTLTLTDAPTNLTWRTVSRLYRTLSQLLSQSLSSTGGELERSESWQLFDKLWRTMLHTVVSWIVDSGGWYAFIRETDYTDHAHFTTSTPDCRRRGFTSSLGSSDPSHCSTPQVGRRGVGLRSQVQSSPTLKGARGGERGSRVLSLTQEGTLEDVFGGMEGVEQGEELAGGAHDEGIQFATPSSGSQSSFASDGCNSPVLVLGSSSHHHGSPASQPHPHGSPASQTRPHSSTLLREGGSGGVFEWSRSMTYPKPGTRRPSSAGRLPGTMAAAVAAVTGTGGGGVQPSALATEDQFLVGGVIGESLDSGLDASSQTSLTSIASTDSSTQYSRLGVSAFCILEAVKSMLDK